MSPNATLLAYSKPSEVKDVRNQAALVSMVWKEHSNSVASQSTHSQTGRDIARGQLETLTVEFASGNIIIKAIQPGLLLVLVGGVAPGTESTRGLKVTKERAGGLDDMYPPTPPKNSSIPNLDDNVTSFESTNLSSSYGSQNAGSSQSVSITPPRRIPEEAKHGALRLQRQKIEAAVAYLRADFDMKGFVMPEEPVIDV